MKDLIQLIEVTNRRKIGKIDIWQGSDSSDSKQSELYSVISNTVQLDEDEVAKKLYGKTADHSSSRFVKLKSRLKQKLFNTILFVEPNDKFLKIRTQAFKQLYFARILQYLGSYLLAKKVLKKTLAVAEKIETFDVAYDALYQLVTIASLTSNRNEFDKLYDKLKHYETLKSIQLNAKCNYHKLTLHLKDPKFSYAKKKRLLAESIGEVESFKNYKRYFSIKELLYRFKILQHRMDNDYEALIKNCETALNELTSNEYFPSDSYFHFKYAALDGFYKLNKHKEGSTFLQKNKHTKRNHEPIGHNLHLQKKYEVLYSFGELNFEEAYETIVEFMNSKTYKNQSDFIQESWQLYHAYAEWGLKAYTQAKGIVSINNHINSKRTKFRLYKFLNEVPKLQQDKTRYNISLLVIQNLHHLLEKDYDAIIKQVDALGVYRSRYLKSDEYKRAYEFLGVLIKLIRSSFDINYMDDKLKASYEYLKSKPDNKTLSDCEIIPFDKLCDLTFSLISDEENYISKAI